MGPKPPVLTGHAEMDGIINEIAERYAHLFTPEQLDAMREAVADLLCTSPEGLIVLEDLTTPRKVEKSGPTPVEGRSSGDPAAQPVAASAQAAAHPAAHPPTFVKKRGTP